MLLSGGNSPTFYLLYNGTKLSFDYTNMKPATKYAFRVQAVNEIGASVFSKETEIESPISQPNIVEKIFADKGELIHIQMVFKILNFVSWYKYESA